MPQEFHVLRCFSCDTFQVHIVKKAKKWECKMCGGKQSFKQNYGKGSAKDCRVHVMKLNELRYMKANTGDEISSELSNEISNEFTNEMSNELSTELSITESHKPNVVDKKPLVSKWTGYLDEPEPEDSDNDEDISFLNRITKKKRKQNLSKKLQDNKKKKICTENYDTVPQGISQEPCQSPNKKTNTVKKNHTVEKFAKLECNSTNTKSSKYSKYLDEDESESNNYATNIFSKNSKIHDSDFSFLDNELNF